MTVHALLEVDVTEPMARIERAEPRVSWTGFIIATVARAVAVHPEVNARKAGNQVLSFHHVDIGATVERQRDGRSLLDVVTIPDADRKPCSEITEVLRRSKYGRAQQHSQRGLTGAMLRLPGPARRTAIRIAATRPSIAATFGPAVGVTSLGMFTHGWGWAIPIAPLTLITCCGWHRGPTGGARRAHRRPVDAAADAELRPRRGRRCARRTLHRDPAHPD